MSQIEHREQGDVTPAVLRQRAEDALRDPGQCRIQLVTKTEEVEQELLPLVVAAVRNEVPVRRIAEMTALAPNTVRAWVRKAEEGQ